MKTIEEKAKAYDESLERAKEQLNGAKVFDYDNEQIAHDIRTTVYNIFPELKESEDEKIRKALISAINNICAGNEGLVTFNGFSKEQVLAWLEKQGKHAIFRNKIQIGDKVTRNDNGELVNLSQLERVAKKLEKQEEQKPVEEYNITGIGSKNAQGKLGEMIKNLKPLEQKPANKVEPKFHEGDFIVNKEGNVYKVVGVCDIVENEYRLRRLSDNGFIRASVSVVDRQSSLWDITKDAKDGDVLAAHECLVLFREIDGLNIRCYCTYHFMNNPSFHVETLHNKDAFHPASKEQRDLLFSKMKEAGYEWDAEKKELKKIEQNPAWSEEDEERYLSCFQRLSTGNIEQPETVNTVGLKSLKDRVQPHNTWKPSDAQMDSITCAVRKMKESACYDSELVSLLNDLKKLKRE